MYLGQVVIIVLGQVVIIVLGQIVIIVLGQASELRALLIDLFNIKMCIQMYFKMSG